MSEPLTARLRRWLAAHRTLVTAAAAAGIMALAGLSALAIVQKKANATERAARQLAEDQSQLAMEAVQRYYTGVNHELLLKQPEMRELRGRLLQAPREFYVRYKVNLERHGNPSPEKRAELAEACMILGLLNEDVGSLDEAAPAYRQALDLLASLTRDQPRNTAYKERHARTLERLGRIHSRTGKHEEAEKEFLAAIKESRELADRFPDESAYRQMVIEAEMQLGSLNYTTGKFDQAEKMYLAILDRLPAPGEASAADRESRETRARCLSELGRLFEVQGRYKRADRSYHEALAIRRQLAGENKDSMTAAEELASSLDELGHLDDLTRLRDRALGSYQDALAIRQSLARDHPNNTVVRRGVAQSWNNIGMVTARLGRAEQAREAFRSAAVILDRLVEDNPSSTVDRDLLFRARRGLGEVEFEAERLDGAETEFQAALAALEPSSAESDQTINMQIDRSAVEVRLGEIDHRRRRFDEALERFGNAIAAGQKVLAREPKHVMARVHLYEAHVGRALTSGCLRNYALAASDWEQAEEYGKGHADSAEIRLRGAMALACRGRLDEAERLTDQVAADPETNLGLQYNCACAYARILAVATNGSKAGAASASYSEALTARAAASLRKHLSARDSLDPDITRLLATDPDLEPLCTQPLFQTFLMDLAFPEQPFQP